VYLQFKDHLGKHFTFPDGAPDFLEYRVVDMLHSCMEPAVKASILELFCKLSHVWVVIVSTVFGMGIGCTDVHHIIHMTPPDSIEAYIQETGRVGRDGQTSIAALSLVKGESKYLYANTESYITNNSTCRQKYYLINMKEPYNWTNLMYVWCVLIPVNVDNACSETNLEGFCCINHCLFLKYFCFKCSVT